MKIGIITFWQSVDNYGQQLQCYALQKYLRDNKHDAYLIRYRENRNSGISAPVSKSPFLKKIYKGFNPIKVFNYFLSKYKLFKKNKKGNARKFEEFRKRFIKQSNASYGCYRELIENPPEADAYIVGSDQVWNPHLLKVLGLHPRIYFLDFGKMGTKRISYAASFGDTNMSQEVLSKITPFFKKFNYISVREKSGVDICNRCGIDNVDWVPDPTMLLDADAYRILYKGEEPRKLRKPYCFLYFLGDSCNAQINNAFDWAKGEGLEIIFTSAHRSADEPRITYATVPEWIYLLEHAEFVITNSYHCSVFALIFRKKFGVMPLLKTATRVDDRIHSLFSMFQMRERFIENNFSIITETIDWDLVSNKFEEMRSSCKLLEVIK